MVHIIWSKPQDTVSTFQIPEIETSLQTEHFVFKMSTVSTPDAKQSEAFIATTALFLIFGSSAKEEKVSMRLPAVWRDLWSEFAEAKKNQSDSQDRLAIKELRDLVRQRQDQELEDGVLLQGAFRGRGTPRNAPDSSDESGQPRDKIALGGPQYYQRIWLEKSSTPRFHAMLVSHIPLNRV